MKQYAEAVNFTELYIELLRVNLQISELPIRHRFIRKCSGMK